MRNIVIYTDKNTSSLTDVLAQIDDTNIRIENADKLQEYETLNPALLVIENVPTIKDTLMVAYNHLKSWYKKRTTDGRPYDVQNDIDINRHKVYN